MEDIKNYRIKKADIFKSASDGILSGYANVYNIEDLQGDISRAGCFVKTVSENHKSMKVCCELLSKISIFDIRNNSA